MEVKSKRLYKHLLPLLIAVAIMGFVMALALRAGDAAVLSHGLTKAVEPNKPPSAGQSIKSLGENLK